MIVTELDLLERARIGDRKALERLVQEHRDSLRRFLLRMTAGSAESEDLLQETLARLVKAVPTLKPGSNIRAWLFRVAANLSMDRSKEKKRGSSLTGEFPSAPSDPSDRAEIRELAAFVQAEIDALPPKYRAVLCLRVYEELSHAEIAEILEDSEENVRWYLFQARKQIYSKVKGRL